MSLIVPRPLGELPPSTIKIVAPYHVALVVDGLVEAVFHSEERLASALLSENHKMIQCDHPDKGGPDTGWSYDEVTGTFQRGEVL